MMAIIEALQENLEKGFSKDLCPTWGEMDLEIHVEREREPTKESTATKNINKNLPMALT